MDKFKYLLIPFVTYFMGDLQPGLGGEVSKSGRNNDSIAAHYMHLPESHFDEDLWAIDTAEHFQLAWDNEICHVDFVDLSKTDTSVWLCVVNDLHKNYALPTDGEVRSPFQYRRNRFHYGVDLPLRTGDTVYAAFDGKVRYARKNFGGYGNLVIVRHHNELETYYAHFSSILVEPDQMVRAGEPIGLGGSTGRSTGPHLHFEVRYLGNAIDPELIFDFQNQTIKDPNLIINKDLFQYKNNPRPMAAATTKYYKIRSGDTLYSIAKRNKTSVQQLQRINKLRSPNALRAGQVIRIN